ncbi:hypothetical protein BD626DRAFT_185258 [Schizophyllum amplum]|uniref:F-box domain-containing protein n=1 Tax=Schizophyllum amplum TaxID=97359 RepID=A0A550C100_9AGAR|nr:hypothetical protein BD626DRAFT_185258 [Auriculariopsis ampla]
MTRRSKPKRARYAYISSTAKTSRPYREILSAELWHLVFSYCLPLALFAIRDTCHMFRSIVDRNDGYLLAQAPLLLPIPPPNPRWYMRSGESPLAFRAYRCFFGITNPRARHLYGSATYTRLLFQPGKCYTCKNTTEGPPAWIHSKVYLCSTQCRHQFFRSQVEFMLPQRRFLPRQAIKPDQHIVLWLPRFTYTRGRKKTAILRRDLKAARKEYWREAVTPPTLEERRRRREALFKEYSYRCSLRRVVSDFQCYIDEWKQRIGHMAKEINHANVHRLKTLALKQRVPTANIRPAVKKLVNTRTQNYRHIAASRLRNFVTSKPKPRRGRCPQCGLLIASDRLDLHVAQHHPGHLPDSRLHVETGEFEHRCVLCTGTHGMKWYMADDLYRHRYHKHGVREPHTRERHSSIESEISVL